MNRIERTIVKETERVIKVARSIYPMGTREIVVVPKLLDYRYAALASFRVKTIWFNTMYCNTKNLDLFISELIPHEVAHLVSDFVYPDAKHIHGKEWKEVCTELGGIPKQWIKGLVHH